MVKKHLFTSPEVVKQLNDRVRDEIDERLFLTMNFKLPLDKPLSASGKYQQYVQILYRFAIDASCVITRAYNYVRQYLSAPEQAKLGHLRNGDVSTPIGCAQLVRTILDHNVSDQNGLFEQEQERVYRQWVADALDDGKDMPETEEDYDRLCVVLEAMAELLVDALNEFITAITKLSPQDKQSIVNRWIEDTLKWYAKGDTRRDIYLGQMALLYEADAGAQSLRRGGILDKYTARTAMENWLRSYYLAQPDCPAELANKIRTTAPNRDKCATLAYFGAGYERRLRETLDNHFALSLLPQDLMQQDIADRLEPVPKTI